MGDLQKCLINPYVMGRCCHIPYLYVVHRASILMEVKDVSYAMEESLALMYHKYVVDMIMFSTKKLKSVNIVMVTLIEGVHCVVLSINT